MAKEPNMDQEKDSALFGTEGELVVDVFETDKEFVVVSAIAGVQIKDLDIALEKNMMVIKGSRPHPHEGMQKNVLAQECWWGPFSRKVVLPEALDIEAADAQIDRGLLTIKIPKAGGKKSGEVHIS